jgi:hypothetical protein
MIQDDDAVAGPDRNRGGPAPSDPTPPTLRHRLVEYPTGPDRCTIYPTDTSGVSRMSTWISIDARYLVDLESVR